MSSKKLKNKSLSERVTESLSANLNASESDSGSETTPKVIDFDHRDYDVQKDETNKAFSQIRRQNVKLLSEQSSKYSGEIASRNLFNTSDDVKSSDSESLGSDRPSFEDEEESQSETVSTNEDNEVYGSIDGDKNHSEHDLLSAENNKLEREKGSGVQNQLAIWEKLLEIRIHSQKMVSKANSLPDPNIFNKMDLKKDQKASASEVRQNVELLLGKLIETQMHLANQFSEIKKLNICSRKRPLSKSNDDVNEPLKKFASAIESNFEKFRPYRNSVLAKWDDRTKLLGATKKKHNAEEFDIVRKVDNILLKRVDLIAKSQKLKGNYSLFGHEHSGSSAEQTEISSPHIYDDTDFYHSQLRELIEFKSNVSSNAYDVTKQFAELQKVRQKMKKKVDTRASKGRKIRYVVHHKLVNFMAPNNTSEWTDDSKNELYRSLFIT